MRRDKFLGERRQAESTLSPHEAEMAKALQLEQLADYNTSLLGFIQQLDFLEAIDESELTNEDILASYGIIEAFIQLKTIDILPLATIEKYSADTELHQIGRLAIMYLEGMRAIQILAQPAWERLRATALTGDTVTLAQSLHLWAQELAPQVWQLYDRPSAQAAQSMTHYSSHIFSSHFYKKYLARQSKKTLQG